jgi:hypothetical protein
MQIIPLLAIPNRTFTITLDQVNYKITLRTIGVQTYVTINMNSADTNVVDGILALSNRPILPYEYLESPGGNFAFYTPNDEYPYYEQFGTTHNLLYASVAELAAYRATLTPGKS